MNQDHRYGAHKRQRFDHPPPLALTGRRSQPNVCFSPNELTSSARAATSEKCQTQTCARKHDQGTFFSFGRSFWLACGLFHKLLGEIAVPIDRAIWENHLATNPSQGATS